jgi:hypothetical protein
MKDSSPQRRIARVPLGAVRCALAMLMLAATAHAAERVDIGKTGFLKSDKGGDVIVYKAQDSRRKVQALLEANAPERLLLQFVACLVDSNTKVLVITGEITGAFSSGAGGTADVMVISGPEAGCRGVVAADIVRSTP